MEQPHAVVMLPWRAFIAACAALAVVLLAFALVSGPLPRALLAGEVFATIVGLFALGSFRYQLNKNALTYGMVLVILATFVGIWWPTSGLRVRVAEDGAWAWLSFLQRHVLSWEGINDLIHADTMLFILGLTLFVAVIAQTRLLESITLALLRRNRGYVFPTVLAVTAVVAFSSGILDGVSMIGLTIRTLVIIMFLANMPIGTVRYAVMICTVVTTVCGMWLAYGEPPNLIMKANLIAPTGESYLSNEFFLRYCLPAAIASYLVIAYSLRKRLNGSRVDLAAMDVLDGHAESVRFLQAVRHGEVLTPVEVVKKHEATLGERVSASVQGRIRNGETLGEALVRGEVPPPLRHRILGDYVSEDLAASLDRHYVSAVAGDEISAHRSERAVSDTLRALAACRVPAQRFGIAGLLCFVGLLLWHAWDHRLPLFVASFAGFGVSLLGIARLPRMRELALHEARTEYAEYLFLFPLFLSITLLTEVGLFERLQATLQAGIDRAGHGHVAFAQFLGCTFLSALLDNNVVADFGSRALFGLEVALVHLFAMAQIAGYAAGGCLTHIGSAQSVVAYAFIKRDIDEHYTPLAWMKEMAPVVLRVAILLTMIIYAESLLLSHTGATVATR